MPPVVQSRPFELDQCDCIFCQLGPDLVFGDFGEVLSSQGQYRLMPVVSMVICNLALEVYMYHRYPKVQIWSFVDDIQALANSAQEALEATQCMVEFCQMLDPEHPSTMKSMIVSLAPPTT